MIPIKSSTDLLRHEGALWTVFGVMVEMLLI